MRIPKNSRPLLLLLLLLGTACRNDSSEFVPDVLVDLTLNLNNPSYQAINVVGGIMFLPQQGYKGISIFRRDVGEFKAVDMTCSYRPLEECHRVSLDSATFQLKCGCCDSRFSFEGQILNGPASLPLKEYRTSYSPSTNTLQITN